MQPCLQLAAGLAAIVVLTGCAPDVHPSPCQQASAGGTRPVLTEIDTGRCLRLPVGQTARLQLDDTSYGWSTPIASEHIVQLVPITFGADPRSGIRDPGYLAWEIRAVRTGTATITAAGRCLRTSCATRTRTFSLTVDVTIP